MPDPVISEIKYLGGGTQDFLEVRVPDDYPDPENLRLVIYDRTHDGSTTDTPAASDIYDVTTQGLLYTEDTDGDGNDDDGILHYTFGTSENGTTIFLHAEDAVGLYNVVTGETYGLYNWSGSPYTVSTATGDPFAGQTATLLDNTGQVRDVTSLELQPDGTYTLSTTPSPGSTYICFTKGTQILTKRGLIAIEDLMVGDMVATMDNDYRPIRWLGNRKLNAIDLQGNRKLAPVRIGKGALGKGIPEQDLMISPQHRLLVRSIIAERIFNVNEVLIPAIKLCVLNGIEQITETTEVSYWHMLFDGHEIVYANGAATESLFTGPEALKSIPEESREEILALFPEIADPGYIAEPARLIPETGKLMKQLVARHAKNEKVLFAKAL